MQSSDQQATTARPKRNEFTLRRLLRRRNSVSPLTTNTGHRSIPVHLRSSEATLPVRSTPHSAGLDLYCAETTVLPPFDSIAGLKPTRIPLGLSMALPEHTYGRITGRSSSTMRGLLVLDGTVDSDYRGSIDVMAANLTGDPITVRPGERIAQMLVQRVELLDTRLERETLSQTSRGEGGFGSTGV